MDKTAAGQNGGQSEEEFEGGADVERVADRVQDQGSIPRTVRDVQLQTSQCGTATEQRSRPAAGAGPGRYAMLVIMMLTYLTKNSILDNYYDTTSKVVK